MFFERGGLDFTATSSDGLCFSIDNVMFKFNIIYIMMNANFIHRVTGKSIEREPPLPPISSENTGICRGLPQKTPSEIFCAQKQQHLLSNEFRKLL